MEEGSYSFLLLTISCSLRVSLSVGNVHMTMWFQGMNCCLDKLTSAFCAHSTAPFIHVSTVADHPCHDLPARVPHLSCSVAHAHTHTHTLSHTHTHTLSHTLSHTHTHTHSLTHSLSLSLTHTHTHTHSCLRCSISSPVFRSAQ